MQNSLKTKQTLRGRFSRKRFIRSSEKHVKWHETFWNELKKTFVNSVSETKAKGHLWTSQKQAIIKLIKKR